MSNERLFENIDPVPNIKVGYFEKEEYLKIIDEQEKQIQSLAWTIMALQSRIDILEKWKRPQGKWIPVSERLPDEKFSGGAFGFDFEEVLCTTVWKDVRAYKFGQPIGHDKPHFWLGGGIMDEYVIAWQPMPEPYKEAD